MRDHAVICEFFELFKTPWEFYRENRSYEVLICTEDVAFDRIPAKVTLIYNGRKVRFDDEQRLRVSSLGRLGTILSYKGMPLPIYGEYVNFPDSDAALLVDRERRQATIHLRPSRQNIVARIGYNLFQEIATLLTEGQPTANASVPTLELHIALLRELAVTNGAALAEIPPIPLGYEFIGCLTHDVDHPSIRHHKFDHTIFGFLYRAVIGSAVDALRRRTSLRNVLKNWAAALKLPLVHLGLAEDSWSRFDRYCDLEQAKSTFFFIPFKDNPGRTSQGAAPSHRASRYAASEVESQIRELISFGCEIAVHGIDAWLDTASAQKELMEIGRLTGRSNLGVRMHWLYYGEQSPVLLDRAGASYDSTVGYNETIGYRAGTTQVYKPLEAKGLLELPMHVMDTALFFPSYMNLSSSEAQMCISKIIDNSVQFGGCVTLNWHDRSIAAERLWGEVYGGALNELREKGAWLATAGQAVSWFRMRRTAVFEVDEASGTVHMTTLLNGGDNLPPLQVRTYNFPRTRLYTEAASRSAGVS